MKNRYCLLPFQFEKIGEQELLVNELGDFIFAPIGTVERIYDAAAGVHQRQQGERQRGRSDAVDADGLFEAVGRQTERAVHRSGVVQQDVDSLSPRFQFCGEAGDRIQRAQIQRQQRDFRVAAPLADAREDRFRFFRIAAGHQYAVSLLCESFGQRLADAAAGSGDDV